MNKVLSVYLVGLLMIAGIVLMTGCDQPVVPPNGQTPNDNPSNRTAVNVAIQQLSGDVIMFNSTEELDNFLKDVSGGQDSGSYSRGALMMDAVATNAAAPMAESKSSGGASEYSQTNVQVEGVDEADFVKNDGKYIYLVENNVLVIVDAMTKKIVSETDLPKRVYASNLFLNDDKIVVLGYSNEESFYFRKYDIMPMPSYEQMTRVLIYDVSDRTDPDLDKTFKVSGNYFQSRMIDDVVYLVSVKYANYPARPPIVYAEKMMSPSIYYFDNGEEQYNYNTIVSIDIGKESVIDSQTYLLGYSNTLMMSEDNIYIAYQKQPYRCWRFYCNNDDYDRQRFTEVVVPLLEGELKDEINNVLRTKMSEDAQWEKISAILSEFYNDVQDNEELQDRYQNMFSEIQEALDEYDTKQLLENSKTVIHKINVDNGELDYDAKGEVNGRLLNQFSMDEYEGNLRLATTIDLWTNTGRVNYNNVYVLDKDMDVIGKIEKLAQNESIYSTRFMGDKLYMVTFRQIDPFFVIDLSNPENPEVLGKLKIPGYSSYLHPYNEDFIIGVGKETGENEWGGVSTKGVKISLFDVSDFENPEEVDKVEIGMQGTDSPILYDHKAFLLFDDVLVIPVSEITSRDTRVNYGYDYSYWDGAYVFKVSENGFDLLGKVKHDSRRSSYFAWYDRASVSRSIIMDNELFTISNKYIKVNDLDDALAGLGSITLPDNNGNNIVYANSGAVDEVIVN